MADQPDLFSKLFRSTKNHLKIQQYEQSKQITSAPITPTLDGISKKTKKPPAKIKIPLNCSKIDLYQTCPQKFYYMYIRKFKKSSSVNANLSFDQTLHATLRDFYCEKKPEKPFKAEKLDEYLLKNWNSKGYLSPEEELNYKNQAIEALKNYFKKFCQVPSRHIEIDYFFKVDLFGSEYSGKIDRVDRLPDGFLELIDYKSGKLPAGGISELEKSLTVQLLFHAADTIWPGRVRKISFIYLKENEALSILRNPAEMAVAKKRYLDICENIYQGKFEPIRSSACTYCEYQDICPIGQIPTLSTSKIKTFLDCPHKYEAYYIRRIARNFDEVPSLDLALDRPLHEALTKLHRDFLPSPNITAESFVFSHFFKAIPTQLPEEMINEMKNLGRNMLQDYLNKLFPKSKTYLVNEFIEYSSENFCFQTTIDRVDQDDNGNLTLIDYKTGRRIISETDLRNDPIIAVICAAAENKYPGRVKKFSYIFLRYSQMVEINVDEMILRKGNHLLNSVAKQIKARNFEPLGGHACTSCAAANICDSKKITVSISRLQTIRTCPKRYKFKYVDKIPTKETEKPALILYQILQNILQTSAAKADIDTPSELLKKANELLNKDNQITPEIKKDLLEKASQAFENYHKVFKSKLTKIHALGESVRIPYQDLILTGRFDRIEILPNGQLHVIIYKTAKKPLSPHEARLDLSGVYNWFLADLAYPARVERLSYFYLLTGDIIPFNPTSQDIEKLKLSFDEFLTENTIAEFEGHRNPFCTYCDYLEICEDAKTTLLSPSKIECFQACPLKYRMKYIDRLPKEAKSTPNLSFDRSIHFALRDFHENYNRRQFKKNPFRQILNKYWIREGYVDNEEEERFKVRANILLEKYFNSLTGDEKPVMFEVSARWHWNGIDTVVQFDRIDELPDGKLEVIDYKTGTKIPDERVLNEDTNLLNMFLAANQKWPGRIAKVSYHYLANNQRYSLNPSDEDIKTHKLKISQFVEQINKNEFKANKGSLCAWCEFYGPCPEWKVKPYEMAGETQEEFRKRIRLSYSKMSLYLNCPRAYRKLYIDKIPPKPQPFFSFGTAIHETFERVYDPNKSVSKPTLEELLHIYDEVRLKHREGFDSDDIEEKYRQDGIRQLTMYYNRYIKNCEFKPAYLVESYFEIPCGKYAVMTGFIDRIDKLEDGTFEILDYKTEPTMRTQKAVDNDHQLSIYYWACEETLGLKISKLSLLMLDHDCKIETTRNRDSIAEVIETVDKTAYAMIHETEFKPQKNKYCKSCDHLHDCPLKEEILADDSLISMKKF